MGIIDTLKNREKSGEKETLQGSGGFQKLGEYIARIDGFILGETVNPSKPKSEYVKLSYTIIHVIDDAGGEGHRAGDQVVWIRKETTNFFEGQLRLLIGGLFDKKSEDVDLVESLQELTAVEQPLAGHCCRVRGSRNTTKGGEDRIYSDFGQIMDKAEVARIITPEEATRFGLAAS